MVKKPGFYWEVAPDLVDLRPDHLTSFDEYQLRQICRIRDCLPEEGMEGIRRIVDFRRRNLWHRCFECGKECRLKCSRCLGPYYCSKECQLADWPDHRPCCRRPNKTYI